MTEEILNHLIRQVEIIANRKGTVDPKQSLAYNGINSMGFMELLLAVENKWGVALIDKGISAKDVTTLQSLADRIAAEKNA